VAEAAGAAPPKVADVSGIPGLPNSALAIDSPFFLLDPGVAAAAEAELAKLFFKVLRQLGESPLTAMRDANRADPPPAVTGCRALTRNGDTEGVTAPLNCGCGNVAGVAGPHIHRANALQRASSPASAWSRPAARVRASTSGSAELHACAIVCSATMTISFGISCRTGCYAVWEGHRVRVRTRAYELGCVRILQTNQTHTIEGNGTYRSLAAYRRADRPATVGRALVGHTRTAHGLLRR
jgi:hypothetical protein